MTAEQKRLVRESFPEIRDMAGPISMLFYGRLFAVDSSLRGMFRQDIALQGRKLMDMLNAVVESIDHLEQLQPTLRALGQRHTGYGVRPEHYRYVEDALLWAMGTAIDQAFFPECKDAWRVLIKTISGIMKEAADELPAEERQLGL